MTDPTPDEAAAALQAVLDAEGRRCGCDPELYDDSDFIGFVSDTNGRGHREVRGAAIRVLLAERKQLHRRLANPCDGESCEAGGAAHCHRCAEAEADKLLAERDALRARIAAAEAQVAKHFQIASRYVGEGSTWAITAQALHAVDRALGGVQVAHDLHGLAGGVISFPPDVDAEDMERFRAAWDEAAGPERALTLNVENRTATFRTKPWPDGYDAGPLARENASRTLPSEGGASDA